MKIAYVRVSTIEQNEQRQIDGLASYNIEKTFIEKASAKDTNRPKLREMLDFAREGDTIYVLDFSRLARSTSDLLCIVEQLREKGVNLVSVKENLDTATPQGKLLLTMIGAINEFERANLLERQREGIAIAKREGRYKGRRERELDEVAWEQNFSDYVSRKINKKELAKKLGVSRPTLDKLLKRKIL